MKLPRALAEDILEHAHEAAPRECCGLIGGTEDDNGELDATSSYRARNVARGVSAFRIHPWDQFKALREMRRRGETMIAAYHSHPRGPALPSRSDIVQAEEPDVHLIASLTEQTVRAFRLARTATQVPVELV